MMPVFFIKGKLRPCVEHAGFSHPWYDKAGVVDDGFLVCVKYSSTSSLVVIPHGKKLGGELIVIVAVIFSNEGYFLYCDLFFDVGYTTKKPSLLFHL